MDICNKRPNEEKIFGTIYEKRYKRQIKKNLEQKKVTKRKGDKLHIT